MTAEATSAWYSIWLYDLCECLKPIFQNVTDDQKASVLKALFASLDLGFKLLSPFMPFILEELYQRLPRADTTPSICVAAYPGNVTWRNERVEKEVDFMQKAARVIRSARSDHNLPNKTKTEAYVVCTDCLNQNAIRIYILIVCEVFPIQLNSTQSRSKFIPLLIILDFSECFLGL